MKIFKLNIPFIIIIFMLFLSCEDILDKSPKDSYSDPVVWSDINLAEAYLTKVYQSLDFQFSRHGKTGSLADEITRGKGGSASEYTLGQITPTNLDAQVGQLTWERYSNIRRINQFLVNIENVPKNYEGVARSKIEDQIKVLKGEALFLRAWEYHTILRSYGGVPIIDIAFSLEDDFLEYSRSTFEETVDFIVKDCIEAAALLNLKSDMEMGRATREAALALKSRVLLFAASDLTADGTAKNELVGYKNPNRTALWKAAKDAAKEVMDLGTVKLEDFGAPDKDEVAENYFAFFKAHTLENSEVIWGRMFRKDVGNIHYLNRSCGPNGNSNFGNSAPLQQFVDSYQMIDGSDFFDHFKIDENNEYVNISTKFDSGNPYDNREPRFYASILYDGAVWQPRFSNLVDRDPIGIYDRRTRKVIENGSVVLEYDGIDTRNGPVDNWNGSYTGYCTKKSNDDKTIGRDEANENIEIYLRYAEVILNYAEACLGLGEEEIASQYINLIRNRSGLPDFKGDITEALRYERKIELFFENNRWYDIRRWKILEEVLDMTPGGVHIEEVTEDGLISVTWKRITAVETYRPSEKLYWIPIADDEMKRAPKLVQNPGY